MVTSPTHVSEGETPVQLKTIPPSPEEIEEEQCRKAQQYHLYQLLRQDDEAPSA